MGFNPGQSAVRRKAVSQKRQKAYLQEMCIRDRFTIMLDKSNGSTPAAYVGGAPNATRGWVAGMIA